MASQQDKRVEVSAFPRAGDKVSEVASLVSVSRTTVYAIKKRMDDDEGVNRRAAGSGRKSVVDRDSLRPKAKIFWLIQFWSYPYSRFVTDNYSKFKATFG